MKQTNTPIDPAKLLNPEEAGAILGMSAFWRIEHVRKQPRVPSVRFGRKIFFRRSDLIQFAADHAR